MSQPTKVRAGGWRLDDPVEDKVDSFEKAYYKVAEFAASPDITWINIHFETEDGEEYVRDRISISS